MQIPLNLLKPMVLDALARHLRWAKSRPRDELINFAKEYFRSWFDPKNPTIYPGMAVPFSGTYVMSQLASCLTSADETIAEQLLELVTDEDWTRLIQDKKKISYRKDKDKVHGRQENQND